MLINVPDISVILALLGGKKILTSPAYLILINLNEVIIKYVPVRP